MRAINVLLASAALVAVSASSGFAADLPVKAPPMVTTTTAFTWTGFYIGGNVGYGWGKFNGTTTLTTPFVPGGLTTIGGSENFDGVIGGGQIGYNWQAGMFVFGVEADIQGAGEERTDSFACGVGCTSNLRSGVDAFATVRGRIGVSPWERGLIYFTGGWAWQHAREKLDVTAAGATTTIFDHSDSVGGWTIGGGVEQMFWDRWSVKVEYLYMRADDVSISATIPANLGGGTVSSSGRVSNNVVRVGFNYHF